MGNMESSLLPDLKDVLYNASRGFKTIPLSITKLSAFPDFRRPRVIVLELDKSEELSVLYNLIQEKIEGLGISKDTRVFSPHITIGRVKVGFKMSRELDQINNIDFNVKEIALVKSELTNRGSIYSNLGVYKLT